MEEHETNENVEPGGTSRRDFIKNSALATGAVWAAPSVLNVGARAFATVSPGLRRGIPGDCSSDGTFYGFKYEVGGGFVTDLEQPGCDLIDGVLFDGTDYWVDLDSSGTINSGDKKVVFGTPDTLDDGTAIYRLPDGSYITAEDLADGSVRFCLVQGDAPTACTVTNIGTKEGNTCRDESQLDTIAEGNCVVVTDDGSPAISNLAVVICCEPATV